MNSIDVQNKLIELKKYVPFLEELIKGLKENGSKETKEQLHNMEMLHKLITNNKIIKLETLVKCETVMLKIYNKKKFTNLNFNKNVEVWTPDSPQPNSSDIYNSPKVIPTERKESPETIDSSRRVPPYEKRQRSKERSKDYDNNSKSFNISGYGQRSRDLNSSRIQRGDPGNFRGHNSRRTQDHYNRDFERRSKEFAYTREYDNTSRNEPQSFRERGRRSRDRDYNCRRGNFRKEEKGGYNERKQRNQKHNYSASQDRATLDNKAFERTSSWEHNTKSDENLYFRRSKTPIDNILTRNQQYTYDSSNQSPNRNKNFFAGECNSKRSKSPSKKNNDLDLKKSLSDFRRDVDMMEKRKLLHESTPKLNERSGSIDSRPETFVRSDSPDWDDEIEESKEKAKSFQTSFCSTDKSNYSSSLRKDCIRDNWKRNKKQWQEEKRWVDEKADKYDRYSVSDVRPDGNMDESQMNKDYDPLTFDPAEEDRQRREKLNERFGLSSNNFFKGDENLSRKDILKQFNISEPPYEKLKPPPEFPDFMKKILDEPVVESSIKENKSNLSVFNRLGNKIEEKLIIRIHNEKAKSVMPSSTATSSTITDVLKSPPLSATDLSDLLIESGAEEKELNENRQKSLEKAPPPPPITFSEFFKKQINETSESTNLVKNFKHSSPKQRSVESEKNVDLKKIENTGNNLLQDHENQQRIAFNYNPHPKRDAKFNDSEATFSIKSDSHCLEKSKDYEKNNKSTKKKFIAQLNDQVERQKYFESKKSHSNKEGNEAKTYGEYLRKQAKKDSNDKVKVSNNEAKFKETSGNSEKQKDNLQDSIINEKKEKSKTHEKYENLKCGKKTEASLILNRELSKSKTEHPIEDSKLDKSKKTEYTDTTSISKVHDLAIENKPRDPRLERASSCLDTLYRNSNYKTQCLPSAASVFKIPKKHKEETDGLQSYLFKPDKTKQNDKLGSKNTQLISEQKKTKAKDTSGQKINVIINRQVDAGSSKSKEMSNVGQKIQSKHKNPDKNVPQPIEVIVTNEIKRSKPFLDQKISSQHSDNVIINPTKKTEIDKLAGNQINNEKLSSKVKETNLKCLVQSKKNILEKKFGNNDIKDYLTQSCLDRSESNNLSDDIFVQPDEIRKHHIIEAKAIKNNRRKSIAGDLLIRKSDIPIDDDMHNDKEDESKVKPIILRKTCYRRKSLFDIVETESTTDNSQISVQNIIEGKRRSRTTKCMNENMMSPQIDTRSLTPDLSKKETNIIENIENKSRTKSRKISLTKKKIIEKMECKEKQQMVSDGVVSSTTDEPTTSTHKEEIPNNSLESFLLNIFNPTTNKQNVLGMLSKVLDNKKFELVKKILEDDDGQQPNTNSTKLVSAAAVIPQNVNIVDSKLENSQKVATPSNDSRTKRTIKKSKTELDRLNEDIRDMFISQGVLNATGRRMCTVLNDKKKDRQSSSLERSQSKERSQTSLSSSSLKNISDIMVKQPKVVLAKLNLKIKPQETSVVTTLNKKKRKKKSNWAQGLIVRKKAKKQQAPKLPLTNSIDSPTLVAKLKSINRPCPKSKKKTEKLEDISEMGLLSKLGSDGFNRKDLKNIYPFMHAKSVYAAKCVLCKFSGRKLKDHYISYHPESEVFISRLPPDTLNDLLQKKNNAPLYCFKKNSFLCYHYRCPFCDLQLSLVRSVWIDHFSMHTGESTYKCSSCFKPINSKSTITNHFSRVCPNGKIIPRPPLGKNMKLVEGYVCDICNYVQMARANMIKHLGNEHNCNLLKFKGIILLNMEDVLKCNELEGGDQVEKEEQNRLEQDFLNKSTHDPDPDIFISHDQTNINLDKNMLETVDVLNQQLSVFTQKRVSSTVSIAEQLSKRFKSSNENATISTELNKDQSRSISPMPVVYILDNIDDENIDSAELAESSDQVIVPVDKPIPSSRANYLNDIIGEQPKHLEKSKSSITDCLNEYFKSPKKTISSKKQNKSTIENNTDGKIIERLNQRLNISPNNKSRLNTSTEQLDQSITSDEGNLVIDESIDDESTSLNQQICQEDDNLNWDDADDDGWEDIEILPSNLETENASTSSEINTACKSKDKSTTILERFSRLYASMVPKHAKSGVRKSIKKTEKIDKKINKKFNENSELSAATESNRNNSPQNDNIINAIPSPANSDPPVPISSEPLKDLNDIQALLDQQDIAPLELDDRIYENIEDALALADELERSGEDPLKNIKYTLDEDFEPLENSPIVSTYRINNFGFKVSTGNIIKYKCLVPKCTFLFTDQDYGLQSHYLLDHFDLTWDGYCYICEENVFPSDEKIPLLYEFRHMKDAHISKCLQKNSDDNAKDDANFKPKISIRRLSGDKLSRASPIQDNQFQNFSDNYSNVFAKPTLSNIFVSQIPDAGTSQSVQNVSIRQLLNTPTKTPPPIKNIQAIMTLHKSQNLSTDRNLDLLVEDNTNVPCGAVIRSNVIQKNRTNFGIDEQQYNLPSGNNFLSDDSTLKISSVSSFVKVSNNNKNNSMPFVISNVASLNDSANTSGGVLMIPNKRSLQIIPSPAINKNFSGAKISLAPSTGLQISNVTTLVHSSENIYTFPNEKSSKISKISTQQSSVMQVPIIPNISSLPTSLKITQVPSVVGQTSIRPISNLTATTSSKNAAIATTSSTTNNNFSNEKGFLKIQNVCSLNAQQDSQPIKTVSSVASVGINTVENSSEVIIKVAVKPWVKPIISKPIEIAKLQLRAISLFALFKCMSMNCFFTTQSVDKMTKHFALHMCSRSDTPNDWLACSYCEFHATTTQEYFLHFNEIHNNDVYQCPYCFYRSCNDCNVLIHFDLHHASIKKKIIYVGLGEKKKLAGEIKLLVKNRCKYVHPIHCKECSKTFYILQSYLQHLMLPHKTFPAGAFSCSLCNCQFNKSMLSEHLNTKHAISVYQCIYCLYSAFPRAAILNHMSNFHPSNLLYSCIRVAPKKDVQVTEETIENSTVLANLSISIEESELRECTFTEEQLNYMSPSLDQKSIMDNTNGTSVLTNITSNNIGLGQTNLYNNIEKSKSTITNLESKLKKVSPLNLKIISVESLSKAQNDRENDNDTELSSEINYETINLIHQPVMNNASTVVMIPSPQSEQVCSQNFGKINEIIPTRETMIDIHEKSNTINMENVALRTPSEIIDLDGEDENYTNNQDDLNAKILEAAKELVKDTGYEEDLYLCPYCTDNNSRTLFHDENSYQMHLSSKHPKSRYICPHCTVNCSQIKYLINHLKIHRRHRYFCYFCNYTAANIMNLNKHIQETHNGVSNLQQVTLAFQNNDENEFQLVCPNNINHKEIVQFGERLIRICDRNKSLAKKFFKPSELEQLPHHAIFHQEVVCSECSYKTKVRANMYRHLLFHQNKSSGEKVKVPILDPVNPVPCLTTNEKQFDKMNNFAFSSNVNKKSIFLPSTSKDTSLLIENPQLNKSIQDEENRQLKTINFLEQIESKIPKYVVPNKRFFCGVANCNHLTVSDYMLKFHLQTLHSNEKNYECPHCRENVLKNPFNIEKIIQHLKFHDAKIFICVECTYMHYQKHLIDRHVNDKHTNQTVSVVTYERSNEISRKRTIQTYSGNRKKTSKTTKQSVKHNDPINNNTMMQWKCSLCKHNTVTCDEMSYHVNAKHGVRFRYACLHCKYGAGQLSAVKEHITDKHPTKKKDVKCAFNRLDDPNPTCLLSQDNRPLWSRADPSRIKHIRGILMEEESEINIDVGREDIALTPATDFRKNKKDDQKNQEALSQDQILATPLKSNKPGEEIINDMLSEKISGTPMCNILECCSCTFRNISFKAISSHWQQHHGEKSLSIIRPFTFKKYGYVTSNSEECPMPSLSNDELNMVLKVGMRSVRYQCNRCCKLFNTDDSVTEHKKIEHPKLKMVRCLQFRTKTFFVCYICEYASPNECKTAVHLLNHYEPFKKCHICKMEYDRFLEFIKHLPKHNVTLSDFLEIDENIIEFWNKTLVLFPNGLFVQRKNLPESIYLHKNLLKNVVDEIENAIYNIEAQNANQIHLKASNEKIASDQSESDNELVIDEDLNSEDTVDSNTTMEVRRNKKSKKTDYNWVPNKKRRRIFISSSSSSDNDAELSLNELPRRLLPSQPYSYYGRKPEPLNLSAIFIKTSDDSKESETITVEHFARLRPIDVKVVIKKLSSEQIEQMKKCSSYL